MLPLRNNCFLKDASENISRRDIVGQRHFRTWPRQLLTPTMSRRVEHWILSSTGSQDAYRHGTCDRFVKMTANVPLPTPILSIILPFFPSRDGAHFPTPFETDQAWWLAFANRIWRKWCVSFKLSPPELFPAYTHSLGELKLHWEQASDSLLEDKKPCCTSPGHLKPAHLPAGHRCTSEPSWYQNNTVNVSPYCPPTDLGAK